MSLGAGSFYRDFTEKKSPQCRAYTWALQMEKSISPLFPGPEGAVVANDWCINKIKLRSFKSSKHINEKGDRPYRGFGYLSLFSDPLDFAIWSQRE